MEQRINPYEKVPTILKALYAMSIPLKKSSIEEALLDLIYFRVSQINGCAYCLDMHSKDLRVLGETEQRLYLVSAWKETTMFSEKERAALAWAEAVTNIKYGVPDQVYEEVLQHFSEEEAVELTLAVIAINSYNRMNVAFRTPAGSYQPGQFAEQ
ncbi:MAG TPA: carboxymuconolactone decarboxylase family protein [Flavisolibacter sp.]|nr:carboxymuconolactone decarboxylase family protein [Flavisolibacter sp.]